MSQSRAEYVTTDNFFMNLKTAKELLQHNCIMFGTIYAIRQENPAEIRVDDRFIPLFTSKSAFAKGDAIMMASYKAKNKTVYIFSSMHTVHCTASLTSTVTKGGVDIADEMLHGYSVKAASRRWLLACFFSLIHVVTFNTYIIAQDIGGHMRCSRRDLLIRLG